MNESDNKLWSCVGMFLAFVLAFVIWAVWGGYVLSILWGWFIVPFGLPNITIAEAVGISIIISSFKASDTRTNKNKSLSTIITESLSTAIISPGVTLALGWVVHLFL